MKRLHCLCCALLSAAALLPLPAEKISFQADSMSGVSGQTNEQTVLSGNASVITETMEIAADTIELSGTDFRFITATGQVSGTNTESQLQFTCSSMRYDRTTKIAILQDSVHLVDVENDVTADAELIEYNQTTDIAVMQIQVTLVQKDNTCTAAYAVYQKEAQLLTMTGNPQIVQGTDTFRALEIQLNLDTQEIKLDGRVKGSVTTKDSQTAAPSPEE